MKNKTYQTCIRTIRETDKNFHIEDGDVVVPRATFEISANCPNGERFLILQAINHGYIKFVANVKDTELFWEAFQK